MKLKSYRNIWNVNKTLYSIQDFKLPVPIPLGQAAIFLVIAFGLFILSKLPPFIFFNINFLALLAVAFILTILVSKINIGGKSPVLFLASVLMYNRRNKLYNRYKPVNKKPETYFYGSKIGYRYKQEVMPNAKDTKEEAGN